jgi:putative endonuclease
MKRGAAAEDLALDYLRRQGLRLLARNLRLPGGELDLLMLDGDALVVVEVRQRSRSDFGSAAESVGARKRARLIHAARLLPQRYPEHADLPLRFDVLAVDGTDSVQWIRSAFDSGDGWR